MRIPKWLIPVIAIVAGLAIGVAAAFIGGRLTAPKPESAPKVISVPILAPTAVGGTPTSSLLNPDGINVSNQLGTGDVAAPGSGAIGPVDATVQAEIDALNAAGGVDPGDADSALAGAADDAPAPADDPCSPADGSDPPADCPGGLHSAIFADTAPPALTAWVYFRPPATEAEGWAFCPATPDSPTSLPVGFATSVPADVSITYWPVTDPTDVHTQDFLGNPDEATTWNTNAAAGSYPPAYTLFQHCGVITGLHSGTTYTMSYVAHDVLDRGTTPQQRDFSADGAPTMPPLNVIPLSNDLIYVSAPALAVGNPPAIHAWVPGAGEPADCSGLATAALELPGVGPSSLVAVTSDYNRLHNYDPVWSYRLNEVLSAPEGSTIVVCARWFNTSGPSWSRTTPVFQQTIVLGSPDVFSPVVTLAQVNPIKDLAEGALKLQVTTQAGLRCGAQAYLPAMHAGAPVSFDTALCSARDSSHFTDWLGLSGNLVLTSELQRTDRVQTNSYMIPLARYTRCTGASCPTPPELQYSIPLPTVTVATGLCGGFGDCTPPSTETSVGSATVTVTWRAGASNGLAHWSIGAPDATLPDVVRPDAPQLDTAQQVILTPSADGFTSVGAFVVSADRHVQYRVNVSGDCFTRGSETEFTGETGLGVPSTATLHFGGLCPGSSYHLAVTLIDDNGHASTYSPVVSGAGYWPNQFSVPTVSMTITGTATVTSLSSARDNRPWGLIGSQVEVNSDRVDHMTTEAEAACHPGSDLSTDGSFASFTAVRTQQIHLRFYTAVVREGLYNGHNYDATCSWPNGVWLADYLDTDVTWEQLSHGVTISGDLRPGFTGSSSEYHVVYHLQATRG
ncbi:MAG: hypothetical protein ABI632_04310 [Pseudolysinimonas sp.]